MQNAILIGLKEVFTPTWVKDVGGEDLEFALHEGITPFRIVGDIYTLRQLVFGVETLRCQLRFPAAAPAAQLVVSHTYDHGAGVDPATERQNDEQCCATCLLHASLSSQIANTRN